MAHSGLYVIKLGGVTSLTHFKSLLIDGDIASELLRQNRLISRAHV